MTIVWAVWEFGTMGQTLWYSTNPSTVSQHSEELYVLRKELSRKSTQYRSVWQKIKREMCCQFCDDLRF